MQHVVERSAEGTIRGMHYQLPPSCEVKVGALHGVAPFMGCDCRPAAGFSNLPANTSAVNLTAEEAVRAVCAGDDSLTDSRLWKTIPRFFIRSASYYAPGQVRRVCDSMIRSSASYGRCQ